MFFTLYLGRWLFLVCIRIAFKAIIRNSSGDTLQSAFSPLVGVECAGNEKIVSSTKVQCNRIYFRLPRGEVLLRWFSCVVVKWFVSGAPLSKWWRLK